jgi:hypothetical protein
VRGWPTAGPVAQEAVGRLLTAAGRHALAVAGAAGEVVSGSGGGRGSRRAGGGAGGGDEEVIRAVERMRRMLVAKLPKMRFPQRGKEGWELGELVERSVSFLRKV